MYNIQENLKTMEETMDSLIEKLFYDFLESYQGFQYHLPTDKEWAAFENFQNQLPKSERADFDKLIELYLKRQCEYERELFTLGFRLGTQMLLEASWKEPF